MISCSLRPQRPSFPVARLLARIHHWDERKIEERQHASHIVFGLETRIAILEESDHQDAEEQSANPTTKQGRKSLLLIARPLGERRGIHDPQLLADLTTFQIRGDVRLLLPCEEVFV